MTEAEIRKTGTPALILTIAMTDVMRVYERSETKDFMKILVDRDNKQIQGASFLGFESDEVIQCVLDIMYAKAPYTVIQRAMHIHPTVSEFIPTIMDKLKPLQGKPTLTLTAVWTAPMKGAYISSLGELKLL